MIITIDGPIATGKSTIAKRLAHEIGFIYFDTGAMYRCLAYGLMKQAIDYKNRDELIRFLKNFKFNIRMFRGERNYLVNDEDVTERIRMQDITAKASEIAAIPEIRESLVKIQRDFAVGINAVFEGRDMGSVVFPEAEVKVYLTGRPEVRAQRRFEERLAKYPDDSQGLTIEKMMEQINHRDHMDMTRKVSPLIQPKDALVIDTSDLTIDEIVNKILEYRDTLKTNYL